MCHHHINSLQRLCFHQIIDLQWEFSQPFPAGCLLKLLEIIWCSDAWLISNTLYIKSISWHQKYFLYLNSIKQIDSVCLFRLHHRRYQNVVTKSVTLMCSFSVLTTVSHLHVLLNRRMATFNLFVNFCPVLNWCS